jgi:ATP-dependent RNA helicase DDX46/PRP5
VHKFRKEAGDIKIRGKNILNPVFNWYHCGFSDTILSVIEKNQFEKPFPIQAQSIPMILSGRDVIGIAETGSGKTFAYLLPMLKHVAAQRPC